MITIQTPLPKYKIGEVVEYFDNYRMPKDKEVLVRSDVMRIDEMFIRLSKRYYSATLNNEEQVEDIQWKFELEICYASKNTPGWINENQISKSISAPEVDYALVIGESK